MDKWKYTQLRTYNFNSTIDILDRIELPYQTNQIIQYFAIREQDYNVLLLGNRPELYSYFNDNSSILYTQGFYGLKTSNEIANPIQGQDYYLYLTFFENLVIDINTYNHFYLETYTVEEDIKPIVKKPKLIYKELDIDYCNDYEIEFKGDFVFHGQDYQYLLNILNSEDKCTKIYINCYQPCITGYALRFQGYFTVTDCFWKLDHCICETKLKTESQYDCFEANKNIEYNVFDLVPVQNRKTIYGTYGYVVEIAETFYYADNIYYQESDGWYMIYSETTEYTNGVSQYFKFQRVLYTTTAQTILSPSNYILISQNSETKTWAKILTLINVVSASYPTGDYYHYYYDFSNNSAFESIDNGLLLRDVLQGLINKICDNLVLKSEFFQWNIINTTNINYVTGLTSEVLNLILFQKMDVKTPNVSQDSYISKVSIENFLKQICEIFNLNFKINNGYFELEHSSYFDEVEGLDLTTQIDFLKGTNQFDFDVSKLANRETFEFMESDNIDFKGVDIIYENDCADVKVKKEHKADIITTDIEFVLSNPQSDSDKVNRTGFVLVACYSDNTLIQKDGILETNQHLNNTLSWANLHKLYYKHNRLFAKGLVNNVETIFLSTQRFKMQDTFKVLFCCEYLVNFVPTNLIKTHVGWGKLTSLSLDIETGIAEIELKHTI